MIKDPPCSVHLLPGQNRTCRCRSETPQKAVPHLQRRPHDASEASASSYSATFRLHRGSPHWCTPLVPLLARSAPSDLSSRRGRLLKKSHVAIGRYRGSMSVVLTSRQLGVVEGIQRRRSTALLRCHPPHARLFRFVQEAHRNSGNARTAAHVTRK